MARDFTMPDLDGIFEKAAPCLRELVSVQDAYDEVGWRVSSPRTAKFRHICLHLMDVTAKLARIAEQNDHQDDDGDPVSDSALQARLESEGLLLAELGFSLLQLTSLGSVDLASALHDLYRRNASHFAPASSFAELEPWRYDERLDLH